MKKNLLRIMLFVTICVAFSSNSGKAMINSDSVLRDGIPIPTCAPGDPTNPCLAPGDIR